MSSLGLSLNTELKQSIALTLPFDRVADVELISLHRIRSRIHTLDAHEQVKRMLIAELVRENAEYRAQEGHSRYCITPEHVEFAVDGTRKFLDAQVEIAIATLEGSQRRVIGDTLKKRIQSQEKNMKDWFDTNYDALIYDTSGKIPYHVVQRLRTNFRQWALGQTNPFQEPMTDVVQDVMRSLGYDTDVYSSPEDNWELLKTLK